MSAAKQSSIGWIGIGRMGYAMAERLAKAGADVTVWNRTRNKAEPLAAHGAKIATQVSELANCDIVFVAPCSLNVAPSCWPRPFPATRK